MNSVHLEKYLEKGLVLLSVEGTGDGEKIYEANISIATYSKETKKNNKNTIDENPQIDQFKIPGEYLKALIGMLEMTRDKLLPF